MFNVAPFLWTMLVLFALALSNNLVNLSNMAIGIRRPPLTPRQLVIVIVAQTLLMFWLVMLLVTR